LRYDVVDQTRSQLLLLVVLVVVTRDVDEVKRSPLAGAGGRAVYLALCDSRSSRSRDRATH